MCINISICITLKCNYIYKMSVLSFVLLIEEVWYTIMCNMADKL